MASQLPGPALLFCPGNRPERFEKAAERADGVILDLEDGVHPDDKKQAREAVVEALSRLDRDRTIVRVNPPDSATGRDDLAALRGAGELTIMVPKAERAVTVEEVGPHDVIALCETAAGVLGAAQVAAAGNCVALLWGGEDLMASLGGRGSHRANGGLQAVVAHARSVTLLAAKAHGRLAIDAVRVDIEGGGLAAEAAEAASLGFDAKACIHPSHVAVIREAFAPSEAEASWADGLLEAHGEYRGEGVFVFEGRMIDAPLLAQARKIKAAEAAKERWSS